MSSRLPKPSGLKQPHQIKPIKPLGTLVENVVSKNTAPSSEVKIRAYEAPTISRCVPVSRLKRRSKSVSDLRSLIDKPLASLKPFKLPSRTPKINPIEQGKQSVQNKILNCKAPNKTVPIKPNGATGTKRPLTNKSDEGVSKPKVSKKIPDWDYKSRFNQLNEKYQYSQECIKDMKMKISQFDEIQENYSKVQEEFKIVKEVNEKLESNLQEANRIRACYAELTTTYNNLREQYEELIVKHNELTEKYSFASTQNENLLETVENDQKEIRKLREDLAANKTALLKFETERRVLHNVIQDLKGNIRVFCRVRPPLPSEVDKLQCCINFLDENGLEIRKSRESVSQITGKLQDCKSEFTFDKVFSHESTQEEVFEDLAQLVQSALDGYDICVFAYGQTGSGKTYTMLGADGPEEGMIPRTIQLIFENISILKRLGWQYTIQASFLEIYNENVRDLLNLSNSQKLEIYFNEGKGTTVTNLTKQYIESAEELEKYMKLSQNNRATATTDFNEHSSRSHAVTKIYLEGTLKYQDIKYTGCINLVDLAGSESAKQSVVGDRLTETKNINKSLATLGDVISALHNKSKHIPYRNSKLTYLLQSSLGGNSKTLMIVNIAPFEECFGESISSLRFAAKVKEVKTRSKRNKMATALPGTLIKQKTSLV